MGGRLYVLLCLVFGVQGLRFTYVGADEVGVEDRFGRVCIGFLGKMLVWVNVGCPFG